MTATTSRTLAGVSIPAAGTYDIDASHSSIGFVARHLMVTKVRGRFTDVAGEIVFAEQPLESAATLTIQAASVTTSDDNRDAHVKGEDFFDVEKYPTLSFTSTGVQHVDGSTFRLTGDLTIKDVTKPVTLEVEYEGEVTDPWGGSRVGFTARTEVDRETWGLTWNVGLEAGGVLVSKKVVLELDVQAVRRAA